MALLSVSEINHRLEKIKEWSLAADSITKKFEFSNFKEAIEFVNNLAEIAEKADHHPDIFINYKRVTLTISTHSEGGLTEKDFNLAEKIEKI